MLRPSWSVAGLFTVALALGCTQAPSGSTLTDQPPEASATGAKESLQCERGKEHWRTVGEPKRGGVLVRSAQAVDHFDATKTGGTALTAASGQLAESLVEARECFYEDVVMVPALAQSWDVAPDAKTWTFKLRSDVRWQNKPPVNGRPFTSADVAWMVDYNKREGLQRPLWAPIAHEEPDAATVVFRLREPDADFLAQLGYRENVMLPHEVKEQYGDFKSVAIGTGAFMLKDFKPNQEYNVEPNPDYYQKGLDGKTLPYLAGVRTIVFGDDAAEVAALNAGQLDETDINGIPKIQADRIRESNPQKLRIYEHFNPGIVGVWFDTRKPPLNDARVRRAIGYGLDAEEFIARYQGGAVRAGFIPATLTEVAWSQEKLKEKFSPDREQAKRLLAEAGFKPGERKLVLKTGSNFQQDAELAQRELEAIGVQTTIAIEGSGFSAVLRGSDFDLGIGSPGGFLYPNYWLRNLLVDDTAPAQVKGARTTETDRLTLDQAHEMDPMKRKALLDQLQERLYDTMPQAPLVTHLYYHARSCRLRNASLNNPTFNARMPVEAWLDPAEC